MLGFSKSATIFVCLISNVCFAQNFEFNENCQTAYKLAISFRFEEANKLLELEESTNQDNLIPLLIRDIEDASRVFITEEQSVYDKLKGNKKIREAKIEKGNKKSPWYLYSLAEINLHWAAARLKFEEYISSAVEVNRAYGMLKENEKKFPSFGPTHKSLGLMRSMIGSLPDQYQWLLKFVGVSGNFYDGYHEIKRFEAITEKDSSMSAFATETMLFAGIIEANFMNSDENAIAFLDRLDKLKNFNPLLSYVYLSTALKTGQSERVFKRNNILDFDKRYFQFQYLNLLYGEAKLCRGDEDADVYIKKFLKNFKGKNYIKNANMRLWWYSIINEKPEDAKKYFEEIKGPGITDVDEDKYALSVYKKKYWPEKSLLKARVLFDGGYYTRALQVITKVDLEKLTRTNDRVEFMYRLGRIYQRTNNFPQAINSYEKTIQFGANIPEYFAASACFELGKIYELKKEYDKSLLYLNKSKTFKNHSYRTSLNQKAKAAINRVEAKKEAEKR
jgi:hypothetical protein